MLVKSYAAAVQGISATVVTVEVRRFQRYPILFSRSSGRGRS